MATRVAGKFGRKPALIPAGLRELGHYAAGSLPKAPASVEVPDVSDWGMLGNDTEGDCGVAGGEHGFMANAAIAGETEQFPTAGQAISYYLTYTGGQDTGVVLSDYLSYVRTNGYYGHTVKAYAPVAVHDIPTLQFATWAYGFAYTGIAVTKAMMAAFADGQPWTLRDVLSPVEGGHCIPIVGYDDAHLHAVTWGQIQKITYPAWHHMSSEAWAVITGEFVASGGDTRGVDLAALEADINQLAA